MHLEEFLTRLKKADLETGFEEHFPDPATVAELDKLRERLKHLRGIPGFSEFDVRFEKTPILHSRANKVTDVSSSEMTEFTRNLAQFRNQLLAIKRYLTAGLRGNGKTTIIVKLASNSFRELIDEQSKLEKALTQLVLLPQVSGQLDLENVEAGSLWLRLGLGSLLATTVVGTAAWSAAVVYKKTQEARIHAQYAENLKLKGEMLAAFTEAQKKLLADLVDGEARAIAHNCIGENVNPEEIERIKHTIRELAELMEKGAEIHPALQAPEDVKNLFPDFSNIMMIESHTPRLPAGVGTEKAKAKRQREKKP